jgi:hypothetical protein
MEFERVWSVPVGCVVLQILWQIDNVDGIKGTFFNADTASYKTQIEL